MRDDGGVTDTKLVPTPYDHLAVPGFVPHDAAVAAASFPAPDLPGVLPAPGKPRNAIMLNWVVDAAAARRETLRHTVSAGAKGLFAA